MPGHCDRVRTVSRIVVTSPLLVGLALVLGGCDSHSVSINGHNGVPLANLELGGPAPSEITLLGPDRVNVRHGDHLAISVSGDPAITDHLRYVLADGKLGIGRQSGLSLGDSIATITVTLPAPHHLVMAGSGLIDADSLAGDTVGATVAGSGTITIGPVEGGNLAIEILGSGNVRAVGRAQELKLTIAGTGNADLAGLVAAAADIDLLGTGGGQVVVNGPVHGTVIGTGDVRVRGKAVCAVTTTGSGRVNCAP